MTSTTRSKDKNEEGAVYDDFWCLFTSTPRFGLIPFKTKIQSRARRVKLWQWKLEHHYSPRISFQFLAATSKQFPWSKMKELRWREKDKREWEKREDGEKEMCSPLRNRRARRRLMRYHTCLCLSDKVAQTLKNGRRRRKKKEKISVRQRFSVLRERVRVRERVREWQ